MRSCRGPRRWSSGTDVDGREREVIDETAADAAAIDVASGQRPEALAPSGGRGGGLGSRSRDEHGACGIQRVGDSGTGVEAIVADLVESVGQDVLHEAAQELDWVERGGLAVLGAKGDGVVGDGGEAAVGDADTMRVAAQVTQDVIRAPERLLGVDDPGHASET